MTSKEALEFFVKNIDCDVYEFDLDKVIKHKRCLEQDLERLEKFAHENASLHTEIESLQSENEIWKKAIENSNKAYDVLMQNSNIQFLNQNQEIFKLKKVIEILKDKLELPLEDDFDVVKKDDVHLYRLRTKCLINEEEYEILKEYL